MKVLFQMMLLLFSKLLFAGIVLEVAVDFHPHLLDPNNLNLKLIVSDSENKLVQKFNSRLICRVKSMVQAHQAKRKTFLKY